MTDRAEFRRLSLQLERDLVARSQLRALLVAADQTVADHRQEIRNVKGRMARFAGSKPTK
jgi:hypothetical protein